ncbi:MAG TPA: sugar-binding protein [Thermoanaerobaculia bacterium]
MARLLSVVIALCLSSSIAAQAVVRKTAEPVRVDGVLDDAAWRDATPIPIAHEWFPSDNIPAVVKTDALVAWDDDRLYVAFRAFDPQPSLIRARYAERDAALQDDTVGFMIDPFNDERLAYQFRINPLGVQADAINSDVEGTEDFSWDAIWDSAGRIVEDGYIVEVAIPLQQLRIPTAAAVQTWGFMAMRDYPRNVRHRFRSVVTDQNRNCLVCQLADLGGFGVTTVGRNIELTPTLTGTLQQESPALGAPVRTGKTSLEPGVSGRWAITPGTSLQATINPDFSHVEADAAQLDINTRFALSFAEKRPFFLEGADFFETQLPLVYTRTIADPAAGVKLTGKSGENLYGVLLARDEISNFIVPFDDSSIATTLSEPSTIAVARYRRGFGARATAGALVSSRTGDGFANHVLSADTFLRVTEQDSLRFQIAGSRARYPSAALTSLGQPQGTLTGHTLLARYDHVDRNWNWSADYGEVAPEFRADAGLFNQIGIREGSLFAQRRVRGGPDRWFRNLYFEVSGDARREWRGEWAEWGSDIVATYEGSRQSVVSILIAPNQESFDGRTFHNTRYDVYGSIQATRDLSIYGDVNWGEAIDFANNRAAEFITFSPGATFNIGRRFGGTASWVRQTFWTPSGTEIFTADIPQARLLYHFNRRTFVRAILQHRSVDRNRAAYDVPPATRESRGFLSQLLFSYRLDAQTVFLAGYSDNYGGNETVDLTQTNRALFVKFSYAWLF